MVSIVSPLNRFSILAAQACLSRRPFRAGYDSRSYENGHHLHRFLCRSMPPYRGAHVRRRLCVQ